MYNNLLRWALLGAGVYVGLRFLLVPLLPFLIALGLSVLLEPWVQRCRRKLGLRRDFTAASLTTALLLAAGAGLWLLAGKLLDQAAACLDALPRLLQQLPHLLDALEARYAGLCRACPVQVRLWLDSALETLSEEGLSLASEASGSLLAWASGLVGKLPGILLFLATTVLAVYFTALSYPDIAAFIRRQIPGVVIQAPHQGMAHVDPSEHRQHPAEPLDGAPLQGDHQHQAGQDQHPQSHRQHLPHRKVHRPRPLRQNGLQSAHNVGIHHIHQR